MIDKQNLQLNCVNQDHGGGGGGGGGDDAADGLFCWLVA